MHLDVICYTPFCNLVETPACLIILQVRRLVPGATRGQMRYLQLLLDADGDRFISYKELATVVKAAARSGLSLSLGEAPEVRGGGADGATGRVGGWGGKARAAGDGGQGCGWQRCVG